MTSGPLLIGGVARRYGVSDETVRSWEKKGLVTPQRAGVYRVYSEEDIKHLDELRKGTKEDGGDDAD